MRHGTGFFRVALLSVLLGDVALAADPGRVAGAIALLEETIRRRGKP